MKTVEIKSIEFDVHLDNGQKIVQSLGSVLHGVIMSCISTEYATFLHTTQMPPYHQYVYYDKERNTSVWRVTALTTESVQEIIEPLLNIVPEVALEQKNGHLVIDDRRVIVETTYSEIAKSFLGDTKEYKKIDIHFITPTSFKVNQEYAIFPDVEKMMRSFLKKWNAFSTSDVYDDEALFQATCTNVYVADYRMRLQRFYLERTKIPGFQGNYTLVCKRNMILSNLAAMLCYYGTLSGCGIKVAIGMGAIHVNLEEMKN